AVQVAAQMTQTLQQHLQISRAKLHQQSSPHSVENRRIQYHQETPNDDLVPTTSYMELPINETPDLEELEDFAQAFRERRIQLGFTQADVGIAMGKQYGRHFSHPTVSRFEALNLSYKNVCKLKPMLQKWIESMDNSLKNPCATTNPTTSSRRRITRTQIGTSQRVELTRVFIENPKPNSLQMIILAQKLGMRVAVVQVWFRNQFLIMCCSGRFVLASFGEAAEMSQTLQQQLQEIHVQEQQSDWHPPPPPYPLHLLQSECHKGHGQSNQSSDTANVINNEIPYELQIQLESLSPTSSYEWQNWDPSQPFQLKPPPPYPHHLHDHEHSNNTNKDLAFHPQNQQLSPIFTPQPAPCTTPPETPNVLPNNQLVLNPAIDETKNLEEMEQFAQDFRKRRIKLGFTQKDVGGALSKLYGNDFSPTTISRFEALKLSLMNMCNIKPWLEKWLEVTDNLLNKQVVVLSNPPTKSDLIRHKRRKRTKFATSLTTALQRAFTQEPRPTHGQLVALSDNLGIDREVVRIWFCNRSRAKERRLNPLCTFESPPPPIHQHDIFTFHGETQGSGVLLPRSSSPPPYSDNHLVIQID
ncbi:POU domain, class 2, transcription factor 1, partial [Orchesella cincta]